MIAAIDAYASEFGLENLGSETKPQASSVSRGDIAPKPSEATLTDLTADAAEAAIIKANAPLTLARLEDVVRAAGVSLPEGKKARNILGARLYNSGRFIANRGTGYLVKDRPRPGELDIASNDADENGALHGNAESAPETEEGATSSIENRSGLRLIG